MLLLKTKEPSDFFNCKASSISASTFSTSPLVMAMSNTSHHSSALRIGRGSADPGFTSASGGPTCCKSACGGTHSGSPARDHVTSTDAKLIGQTCKKKGLEVELVGKDGRGAKVNRERVRPDLKPRKLKRLKYLNLKSTKEEQGRNQVCR